MYNVSSQSVSRSRYGGLMMRSQLNLAKVKNLFASPQKAMCAIRYISGVGSENICIGRSSKPSRTALCYARCISVKVAVTRCQTSLC